MAENPNQPKEYDAVLGGQNPPPIYGAVLGGIAGVKKRLDSPVVEVRIAAVSDALKFGEKGLDLVLPALQYESIEVKSAAYFLLIDRHEQKVKQQLDKILPLFEFEVVTVGASRQINSRRRHSAQYFTEDLGNGVNLEMVLIPGGTFLMGSPETEAGRSDDESPQHQVTVKPFFMGKFLVTQAQWKAVAALPPININLNPDPSGFKGENRPVERVFWSEAQEFCARLSQKTGKIYRLPSEAQWEYACRGGTTTPFHFGETITNYTTQLANYDAHVYARQTTDVGIFPPNAFGLYDMHGNVWEWCADSWHDNYNGAPSDGSVWEFGGRNYKLLRGGSSLVDFRLCRSASRYNYGADIRSNGVGFRIVCPSAWTP
ncbi:MAG TPA: Sulphatase-modifying factor protein [Cyanobacteria bacterium UBA11369]|nr:Sulphatase-modifying factor protein [Cyanobacteria bacterium UBA11371]HBE30231.1 Sulphatase-modifying factor protein [Cyanobacteria bacterium UBA11368]HBE51631.1 Sulphatase-modifying factor protein [Cyanobacteria bacterium UBA11369]